jgi:hypothetical protein
MSTLPSPSASPPVTSPRARANASSSSSAARTSEDSLGSGVDDLECPDLGRADHDALREREVPRLPPFANDDPGRWGVFCRQETYGHVRSSLPHRGHDLVDGLWSARRVGDRDAGLEGIGE